MMWLTWHFYEVPVFLLAVWKNYLNFGLYYFSIPLLAVTFFAPWRKYRWHYPKGINLGEYAAVFISNAFSRCMGALSRVVLIIVGVIFEVFIAIAGALLIALWLAIPFISIGIILLLIYG